MDSTLPTPASISRGATARNAALRPTWPLRHASRITSGMLYFASSAPRRSARTWSVSVFVAACGQQLPWQAEDVGVLRGNGQQPDLRRLAGLRVGQEGVDGVAAAFGEDGVEEPPAPVLEVALHALGADGGAAVGQVHVLFEI